MRLSLRSIGKGAKSLGYTIVDRVKGQRYEKKRDLVRFDRPSFSALSIGILEPSRAPLEDILRCNLVHQQAYQNSKVASPLLYWNDGWLVCMCRETEMHDEQGFSLAYPYVCFTRMEQFRSELTVPNMKPETSLPVIRTVPMLLKDVLNSVISEILERRKETEP